MKQAVREEKIQTPGKPSGKRPIPWGRVTIVLVFFLTTSFLIAIILATHTYSNVVVVFLVSAVPALSGVFVALLQWLFPRNPDSAPQSSPSLSVPITLAQVDVAQMLQAASQSPAAADPSDDAIAHPQLSRGNGPEAEQQSAAKPLSTPIDPQQAANLLRPATVFLAYAHEDEDAIEPLRRQLNLRGIHCRSYLDAGAPGSAPDDEIARLIEQEADALLISITPASVAAHSLWEQIMPAALHRKTQNPGFSIFPLVRDLDLAEVRQFCASHSLPDLTRFPTYQHLEVSDEQARMVASEEWNGVAREVLKAALRQRLQRVGADGDYEPALALHTWEYTPPTSSLDLDLDWTSLIPQKERLPSPEEWETLLLPALRDVKQSLSALTASRRLRLFVQCILPVAIACGFTFPQSSQLTLSITDQYGSWSNEGQPSKALPLRNSSVTHNESSPHVAVVELAISRSTEQGVAQALPVLALTPGHHLRLEPLKGPGRESIKDNAHAVAMARQIGQICQELVDRQGVQHIHLFPALTASLGVLVGQHLNALCPITVYEFSQGTYKPSGTLTS